MEIDSRRDRIGLSWLYGCALAALCVGATIQAAPPADSSSALVARGKYIAIEGDCVSCHTAPGGQAYAGGYPLKSNLGIIYGPNITPDPQTGIGSWTKTDFDKALRLGVSKDGSDLYPAMPYQNYTQMTAADMDALWAYMRSLPAVKNTPPKNTLPFPFNVRRGLVVWQSLYFKPGPFVPDRAKGAQWNRGAYLVQVMGHCDQCHTPRNLAQAPEDRYALGGASVAGWYASDISGDPGSALARWKPDQLAKYLKTGVTVDNTIAVGPMREVITHSLSQLSDADVAAIAVYLKDQPARREEAPTKAEWSGESAGKLVYENQCASCHQGNGKGIAGSVPALAGDAVVTAREPNNVIMAVLEGFNPHGSYGAMNSFANSLTDAQIADVANYVRTAWGNNAMPNATPWGVSAWRESAGTPKNESAQMLCPNLDGDVLQPALNAGPNALKEAAADDADMSRLIGTYRKARPKTNSAQVVEALSTAYCRMLAADNPPDSRLSAQLSDFAQRVAVDLEPKKSPP
jgi:mono/diheme cytochrome c family protein